MNKSIIKDIFKLKMEILEGITEHLPPGAKEKVNSLQRDFLTACSETINEHLEKKKPDNDSGGIKKVSIE